MGTTAHLFILAIYTSAILAESVEDAAVLTFDKGSSLEMSIETLFDDIVGCYIDTPLGTTVEFKPEDKSGAKYTLRPDSQFSSCAVTVKELSSSDNGEWRLYSVDKDGAVKDQMFNIAVLDNEDETVFDTQTLDSQTISTNLGNTITISVPKVGNRAADSCHIRFPNNERYSNTELSNVNVNFVEDDNVACKVQIAVATEDLIGDWVLTSIENSEGALPIKRRLPFTVSLEGNVQNTEFDTQTLDTESFKTQMGQTIVVSVPKVENRNADSCHIKFPNGVRYSNAELSNSNVRFIEDANFACKIQVVVASEDLIGEWVLTSIEKPEGVSPIKRRLPFIISVEGTQFEVQSLDAIILKDHMGAVLYISLPKVGYRETESCHIRFPNNVRYSNTELSNDNVKFIADDSVACKIEILVADEELIGDWVLTSIESSMGATPVKRRLPFTIIVEEQVPSVPSGQISVVQGNHFSIKLEKETDLHDTCELVGPHADVNRIERDGQNLQSCGFIIKNVIREDAGLWEIVYGTKIIYRASVTVKVEGLSDSVYQTLNLIRHQKVNLTIGPDAAVYCKLKNVYETTVYEGLGPCKLNLDRVQKNDGGRWSMQVGLPGKVAAENHVVDITVVDKEPAPSITTHGTHVNNVVTMKCALITPTEVTACVFRDPYGNVHIASQGITEDRYSFNGNGKSMTNDGKFLTECGLQITSPISSELGMWRCSLFTEESVHHGFVKVPCEIDSSGVASTGRSSGMVSSGLTSRSANIYSCEHSTDLVPIVKADLVSIDSIQGKDLTMTCRVPASIKYCYFRSQNGSVFSVSPVTESLSYKYVGSGLDAGECGIRFQSASTQDAGRWTCHVGLEAYEERATMQVRVFENMESAQEVSSGVMEVRAHVHNSEPLDYCRFVRIDGLGFKSSQVPIGYSDQSTLSAGSCRIHISHPTVLDRHPWTVVAKVTGTEEEIQVQTTGSFVTHQFNKKPNPARFILSMLLPIGFMMIAIGLILSSKKSRAWSYQRAVFVRDSFRRSIQKKPITETPVSQA